MTSYAQRSVEGFLYEKSIPEKLAARGWHLRPAGMGTLPDQMRRHLIALRDDYGRPCLFRWMPDFIATTERFGKPRACFIDAKNTLIKSANYSIELNAIETYKAIEQTFFIPVIMLAEGNKAITVYIATNRGCYKNDGSKSNGSGTAFMLINKFFAIDMDEIFGSESPSCQVDLA